MRACLTLEPFVLTVYLTRFEQSYGQFIFRGIVVSKKSKVNLEYLMTSCRYTEGEPPILELKKYFKYSSKNKRAKNYMIVANLIIYLTRISRPLITGVQIIKTKDTSSSTTWKLFLCTTVYGSTIIRWTILPFYYFTDTKFFLKLF